MMTMTTARAQQFGVKSLPTVSQSQSLNVCAQEKKSFQIHD